MPWTLRATSRPCKLKPGGECQPIEYPKPDGKLTFDRLSSGVHQQHQPRGEPALPPDAQGRVGAGRRSTWPNTPAPRQRYCPAGVYEFVKNDDNTDAAADQRAELRALQDLRHQGPDAEHRLGHARRRRRAELRRHVHNTAIKQILLQISPKTENKENLSANPLAYFAASRLRGAAVVGKFGQK
jgi:hypothetical protein